MQANLSVCGVAVVKVGKVCGCGWWVVVGLGQLAS
jgi:hypothetical protein